MGYADTHDVPTVDDTVTINGREVMRVKTVATLAKCGTATVYRAIDWGGLQLVYRGLVDAQSARVWISRWSAERGPQRARKRPARKRPC